MTNTEETEKKMPPGCYVITIILMVIGCWLSECNKSPLYGTYSYDNNSMQSFVLTLSSNDSKFRKGQTGGDAMLVYNSKSSGWVTYYGLFIQTDETKSGIIKFNFMKLGEGGTKQQISWNDNDNIMRFETEKKNLLLNNLSVDDLDLKFHNTRFTKD